MVPSMPISGPAMRRHPGAAIERAAGCAQWQLPLERRGGRWPLAWLVAMAMAALSAQAEPTARAGKPDPLDPKAKVPALTYASSLKPAERLAADKPISWREANDNVARIGGWRVYAREAQQPDPAPAAKPASPAAAAQAGETAKPMPPGHDGHKTP